MQLANGCASATLRSAMLKNIVVACQVPLLTRRMGFVDSRRRCFSENVSEDLRLRFDRPRYDTKVSERSSADALFQEQIDRLRHKRAELELGSTRSGPIEKLQQDEIELTRKIFARADPERDLTTDMAHQAHGIDPYWNPFNEVRDLKEQVSAEFSLAHGLSHVSDEFDEYSRHVDVAEAKRQRIQIKKSLKRATQVYNPYSQEFRQWHGREKGGDQPPKPFRIPDEYWERSPLQEKLRKERITWRDVDIIQHFIADNGYILPRRTTMLSRQQQRKLCKAVLIAQRMSLLPHRWKLQDYQAMPLTDPIQWMVDRLTERHIEKGDRRANAMLKVMIERYPTLNFKKYLAHKAKGNDSDDE